MPDKSPISRREFLKSSAVTGGGLASLRRESVETFSNRKVTSSTEASSEGYYPSPESEDGWGIYEGGGGVK
jgi:TAT (twin-arginine translocation) pathway signal sequence